ncbi:hypothetical protein KDAU_57950 [Dictyobacter aurantiacus]|uniref:Uncharacterized protein n=1 Tax=Dictyobacter aurantiacus TaxID=1936993 RepID=A0A401ZNZ2_9CHLR|nr:hypothetical protein KDAU_57950 [Dictyobacter aurantiacus]
MGGNQQQTSWAVLLCKFKDDQSETPVPNYQEVCERFFTRADGSFNAVRFFSDMSHRSVDLSGSMVFGWFTLDVNVNDVVPPTDPPPPGWTPTKSQSDMMVLAKQAAINAGIALDTFFGIVLIMNVATGWAQGGPTGVFADWRRVDGRNFDGSLGPRAIGGGNGTEIFGQEMGHRYGLGHSRRDGTTNDYQDPWDIMSTDRANSVPDPDYCARGPGLNAWNMRGRGWLDESRVWKPQSLVFDQVVELRPLHQRDLSGWLAAELLPNDGDGGHGRYLIEFRLKEAWDAGIPRSAVFVHRFLSATEDNDGWPHSYIMSGTNGNQDLVEGDIFAPAVNGAPRVEVLKIDENNKIATVQLSFAATLKGLPAMAASGNRTVAVTTTPDGRLVWTSWELGSSGTWTDVNINGPSRATNVAPAVSFRTTEGGTSVWLAIKDSGNNQIYETLQQPGGNFGAWTLIPGVSTNVSPAVSDGNLAVGYPIMAIVAAPPDDSTYINVDLVDQPISPPPPGYWKAVTPSLFTTMAPALTIVDQGRYMFLAVTAINFESANSRIIINQGNPYTPDQLVGWNSASFDSNLPPAMAAANNRTVIVAVDPSGAIFYDWWDLGGGPHGWVPMGDDVRTKVAPAVALVDDGKYMFVYAQGLDGRLYLNQANVGGSIIGWR